MTLTVWSAGFIAAVILFQIVSVPALILKKNDLADVLWGPAFVLSGLAAAIWGNASGVSASPEDLTGLLEFLKSHNLRATLLLALLTLWALRLFAHVGWRNLSHRAEDVRYNNWRKAWGKTWLWRSYLQVFVLQALILYVFLSPVLLAIDTPNATMTVLSWIGLAVALTGFLIESIADEQLRRFKMNPENKGRLMTQGLWSWSRHPNYFGEVLMWWGIWLTVADLSYSWATLVSPIGVTYLILKVSGVSMLEDLMQNRPGYAEYKARTSSFIPLPPRQT